MPTSLHAHAGARVPSTPSHAPSITRPRAPLTVHEREQRGHDRVMYGVLLGGARWRQAVQLVKEDDGRSAHLTEQIRIISGHPVGHFRELVPLPTHNFASPRQTHSTPENEHDAIAPEIISGSYLSVFKESA